MKRFTSFLLLIFALSFSFNATAQMSKQEAKEWKKRKKKLTIEQYKSFLDENKSLKGQVSSMRAELSGVDQAIQDKDDQIAQYQVQIDGLRSQVAEARAEAQKAAEAAKNQSSEPTERSTNTVARRGNDMQAERGIVFKVQIGAFKNKDLSKYLNASSNFSGEVDEDGLIRYTLGVFRDYWEADTFKKYLREMGVSEAWIISYKDGKRVPIKDVLENVSKS